MASGIRVHVDLNGVTNAMKGQSNAFTRSLRRNLRRAVATESADTVAAIQSSASWSKRIPGSIKSRVVFSTKNAAAKIVADHHQAPHARPLELGNKRKVNQAFADANGGYKVVNGRRVAVDRNLKKKAIAAGETTAVFRHPVYGNKTGAWAEQMTHPFFFRAIGNRSAEANRRFEQLLDDVVNDTIRANRKS